MIAQASAAMRHSSALATRRVPLPTSRRRPAAVAVTAAIAYPRPARPRQQPLLTLSASAYRTGIRILKLAAAVLAGATVALAVMNYQDANQQLAIEAVPAVEAAAPAVEPDHNQTVVYRQVKSQARLTQSESEASAASAERLQDAGDAPANHVRTVQTIRFSNPTPGPSTFTLAAATSEPFKLASATSEPVAEPRAMLKVGGFIAFPGKEATDPAPITGAIQPSSPRKRPGTVMDDVDDYLWEVYQRVPVKRDSSGDFSWKDPAAAKRVNMSLQDYVVVGMDPDFREQLYHAGKAMDAAGLQWSMLSAFRDDYRQNLASGFKARGGNSLHGGSTRTGGYGHGRAIDITGTDGQASDVWRWIDAHGAKYGLYRPMPGNDPAHIQQRGDWKKIALTLRATRGVTLVADAGGTNAKEATGTIKETGRRHRVRFARAR